MDKYIVEVPPGTVITPDTIASRHTFPAVPVSILSTEPFISPLIAVAVVMVVVVPPVAVIGFDHLALTQQAPAPKVPARAPDEVRTQASSSKR